MQAPQYASSRSSYPAFLSPQETAWIHLACAGRGLVDAFRWDTVVRLVARCVRPARCARENWQGRMQARPLPQTRPPRARRPAAT